MCTHRPATARALARAIALAPIAALLAACGEASTLTSIPRTPSLTDAQISRDVAASAGQAVALDVVDLLRGEVAAGLTSFAAATCPYDAASSYHVCAPVTLEERTIARRFQFRDASGTATQGYDAELTASVNFLRTLDGSVSGATSDGLAWTRGVHETSNRTVSGLAGGETQRVWNGTDTGADTTIYTGGSNTRTYAASVSQTATDVVVAVPRVALSWPLSGTITRVVTAKLTQSSTTAVRNVVRTATVTFNGTSSVPIVVNGLTCTLDLNSVSVTGCP